MNNNNKKVYELLKECFNKNSLFCPHCVDVDYDYYSSSNLPKLSEGCPCVFDRSALYGESKSLLEGCYHRCLLDRKSRKPKNLILLENKNIFIEAIDRLMKKNEDWAKEFKREPLLTRNNIKQLNEWRANKKIEGKRIHEENMRRHLEKKNAPVIPDNRTPITMYIRGIADYSTKERVGHYAVILQYKNNEKVLTGKGTDATPGKMVFKAMCEALKVLKKPCNITVCYHTYSKPTKESFSEYKNLMAKGGHKLTTNISSENQDRLKKIIARYKKEAIGK